MMKSTFWSATTLHQSVALSFVIPSEAEGSAVPRTSLGNVFPESAGSEFALSGLCGRYTDRGFCIEFEQ
jgi:hypothetical protein